MDLEDIKPVLRKCCGCSLVKINGQWIPDKEMYSDHISKRVNTYCPACLQKAMDSGRKKE